LVSCTRVPCRRVAAAEPGRGRANGGVSAEIEKGNAKATGCTPRGATLLQRKEQQEEEEEEEEEEEQEEEEARRCFNAKSSSSRRRRKRKSRRRRRRDAASTHQAHEPPPCRDCCYSVYPSRDFLLRGIIYWDHTPRVTTQHCAKHYLSTRVRSQHYLSTWVRSSLHHSHSLLLPLSRGTPGVPARPLCR